mgnify:CR=1 FL=1
MGQYNAGILTTAGQQLITQALAGDGIISFPLAKTSSWAIPAETNIQALTDLQNIQQTVTPGTAQVFNGTMIQVQALFSNADEGAEVTQAYLVQTVGLWAQITGGEPTLFSVYQATTPDQMPAYAGKAPSSLIYTLQATVQQASQLTVQVNPAGAATALDIQNLQAQITQIENDYIPKTQIGSASGVAGLGSNSAVPIAQGGTGGNTITEALANLGAQPGFNLLVNSRFKYNGRNQNSYPQDTYTVDGWKYVSSVSSPSETANVVENGIQILPTCGIQQTIQNPPNGKEVTFSAEINGNIISGSFVWNQNSGFVQIYSQNGWRLAYAGNSNYISIANLSGSYTDTLSAAKLELGSVSTLAADLEKGQDETIEQLRLDMYDLDPGRPAWVLTQNENLLDNWYFVGGGSQQGGGQLPVNQQGQTSYTSTGYGIDRWLAVGSGISVSISDQCLEVSHTGTTSGELQQRLPLTGMQNGVYTFSVLTPENLYAVSGNLDFSSSEFSFSKQLPNLSYIDVCMKTADKESGFFTVRWRSVNPNSVSIIAAKLELGPRSTLARLVDGEWVLNDPPPNFQQELAKCQRYLFDPFMGFNGYAELTGAGFVFAQTTCVFCVFFPENMRVFPSLIGNDFSMFRITSIINGVFNTQIPVTNINIQNWASNRVLLFVTTSQSLDIGATCELWVQQASGSPPPILFSSEL